MVDAGIFSKGDHVELLDGAIVEMSPMSPEHAHVLGTLNRLMARGLPEEYWVSPQLPMEDRRFSTPEPDLAVMRGPRAWNAHPSGEDTLLAIEIALSSLQLDRRKARIYAEAGVPEYWLIDIAGRRMEVYSEPGSDGYRIIHLVDEFGEISPAFAPEFRIALVAILPPKRG